MQILKSPAEVVGHVESGQRVFVHGSAATPNGLLNALLERAGEVTRVDLVAISTLGELAWDRPSVREHMSLNSLFVSANVRPWVDQHNGDYTPVFLSEIPGLFRQRVLPLDVAMIHVSPPDKHGYCSLGTSVDAALAAIQTAPMILAQINPRMPRTLGDGCVHVSRIDFAIEAPSELPEVSYAKEVDDTTRAIGRRVAELIEDGSTLQMGIGGIPDAVLGFLGDHKELGIHTEMFSDGVVGLVEKGVVTNRHKKVEPNKILSTFVLGTRKVYDFVDDNPMVFLRDVAWTNDTAVIRKNPKVVAINSALQIDLTGQVCADSLGTLQYSGIGGQMDFMRGAALSPGGKPIIVMPSKTSKGVSRIAALLNPGAGVVTTRGHVHWVVTEHGTVNLYGKGLQERARLLIGIAAPEHREGLEKAYRERFVHRV
jgi:acyl-CoA hydrolase